MAEMLEINDGERRSLNLKKDMIKPTSGTDKKSSKKTRWTKKKIAAVSVIGAGALAFTVFIVIVLIMQLGPVKPIKSTDEEARVIGECGGFEVRYEELRYVVLTHRRALDEKYGAYAELDAQTREQYDNELESLVSDGIKSNYVIFSLCKRYEIDIDSGDVESYVNEQIQSIVDEEFGGSVKRYREWLAENGLTDSLLRLVYKADRLETELLQRFVSDGIGIEYDAGKTAEFTEYVLESDDYVKAIHAFYPHRHPADKADYDALEQATAALESLQACKSDSERFSLMRSVIGRAPFVQGFSVTGTDYYFTYGQMDEKYERVAFSLDEYEVGEIVETSDGYYVIMRVPKKADEIKQRSQELLTQYQYAVLKRAEDACRDSLTFNGNDYFNGLVLSDIR